MDVNIGKLNKRVEIVRISTSPDADGYADPTETVIRRPWAQFSRVSGSEALRQGADMGDVKVRFLIRSGHTAISRKDRVRHNGADYEIEDDEYDEDDLEDEDYEDWLENEEL